MTPQYNPIAHRGEAREGVRSQARDEEEMSLLSVLSISALCMNLPRL